MKFTVTLAYAGYSASVRVHAANEQDAVITARHALGVTARWYASAVELIS